MILVLNTGSSSIKVALFDQDLRDILRGSVSGIGGAGELRLGSIRQDIHTTNHGAAIDAVLGALAQAGHPVSTLTAAAHRVVHGGATLTAPCALTPQTRDTIAACVPLAPLHNPPALAGIDALTDRAPDLPQYASFDTAFHATQSALATAYALPQSERDAGLRRYGFHGLSYAGMVAGFGPSVPDKLLAFHLGAGVSLCAIAGGKSVATSMGYSPLSGPTMATRSGDIDGMAVLRLAERHGLDGAATLLNHHSGLLGLSGVSGDMRTLLDSPDPAARFAVDHFCHTILKQAGGLIALMGGVTALAFTGGIGENSAVIRDRITTGLGWLGPLPVHIVRADEEKQIARDAVSVMAGQ